MFLEVAGFIVGLLGIAGVGIVWALWREEKRRAERDAIEEAKVKRIKEQLINDKLDRMEQRITSLEHHGREVDNRFATVWHELEECRQSRRG